MLGSMTRARDEGVEVVGVVPLWSLSLFATGREEYSINLPNFSQACSGCSRKPLIRLGIQFCLAFNDCSRWRLQAKLSRREYAISQMRPGDRIRESLDTASSPKVVTRSVSRILSLGLSHRDPYR
jgi:hypothetical protein